MRIRLFALTFILFSFFPDSFSQNYPWERPLKIAWSNDGINFNTPAIYQDSSGVPSVVRWKGDTLICAFQWFRQPINSSTWDKVAVKFSYDNGLNWTNPTPVSVNGLPVNYQRPFDPTLAVFGNDSIRMYFSSSIGIPNGLDSTVNTYSAKSSDGIHFFFEPNPRVDHHSNRVIDPAVIYFTTGWHYLAPIGSPQQGAYHYVSPDGLNFSQVSNIPSDNTHNWTGNYMIESTGELRFYGSSPTFIWYNSSPNGGVWNGFVNTDIHGGDPSVLKVSSNNYLMVYVGEPYSVTQIRETDRKHIKNAYPCPARHQISVSSGQTDDIYNYRVYSIEGKFIFSGSTETGLLNIEQLDCGIYLLLIEGEDTSLIKFIKD